jgi:hypothetical protein
MTYSVYQHWDPLKVCVVGRSYPPEFYSWITVPHVRKLFERIAIETEEDYQGIITLLKKFNVEVLRPDLVEPQFVNGKYRPPPMTPRDYTVMIGETFYAKRRPDKILHDNGNYSNIFKKIAAQGNPIKNHSSIFSKNINGAMVSRIGRDLYFGTSLYDQDQNALKKYVDSNFTNTRNHIVNTGGHGDATYCPVCPGLIISLLDVPTYKDTFPGWEVVYLPKQSWAAVKSFSHLKQKNNGKWWIPGFEYDQNVIDVVETWLRHWVGYVEETVFDVNMLIIDPKNVIVFNENDLVFEALKRYGITPHVVTFRHRYFWDGGIHCVTTDLHREGTMQDYFPGRS